MLIILKLCSDQKMVSTIGRRSKMNRKYNCRVCGLHVDDAPWGDNKTPSYEICFCCGVEFGNEDYTVESTKRYRALRLKSGAKWFSPNRMPVDWNLKQQLENVPDIFK